MSDASSSSAKVITRFAPSPTGVLHLGSARTALFNWLFARSQGGKFLLRLEDTDAQRSTLEFQEQILHSLRWLGLEWDEEVVIQSSRKARHQEIAHTLLEQGKAYACYATPEELQTMRDTATAEGRQPLYDRRWRDPILPPPTTGSFAIRLKASLVGETILADKVQGHVTVQNEQLDDMVLLRSDGTPTYMLAVVVDDHDMGITHIIRGNDHLMNAFRQIQLYQALGWEVPTMAHIPLIHGEDGAKLSKRHGATSVDAYQQEGILPEAMRNALLRLGWSHGDDEKISTTQALEWFGLEGLGKTAACFDAQKLWALNAYYLRHLSPQDLLADPFLRQHIPASLVRLKKNTRLLTFLPALQHRAKTLKEFSEALTLYLEADLPAPLSPDLTEKIFPAKAILQAFGAHFASYPAENWTASHLEPALRAWAEATQIKFGHLAQPLRIALTGQPVSPGVFEVLEALGKEWSLHRVQKVL